VEEFSQKIVKALEFSESFGRTKGFDRIKGLGLDSISISNKIIKVYEQVCSPPLSIGEKKDKSKKIYRKIVS
jgi:hypothetical protein